MTDTITHLGGHHTVTGSCHLLQAGAVKMLIDCGSAQGSDEALPFSAWPVMPEDIDYLFLTHAHIDHIGRLPELIRQGFRGEILATEATIALLGPMLQDAVRFLNLPEVECDRLLAVISELAWGFEYDRAFELKSGIRFRFGRAGHILGSCWIRFELSEGTSSRSVVFSGDLGARHAPILPEPDIPEPCDVLIVESTYGDRNHADRTQRITQLGDVLTHALADGGKVFIPAFALGRTQELLYEMDRLFSDTCWQTEFPELHEAAPSSLPVFIDSPLAQQLTTLYAKLSSFWDKEAQTLLRNGDHPIDFDHLYTIRQYADHRALLDMKGPAIILAGSGMCTGGRIVAHLQAGLPARQNDVLFVGYQAAHTPGRDILTYCQRTDGYVILDSKKVPIRARIHVLSGYSAHADQQDLIAWIEAFPEKPATIRLVHGEPSSQQALRHELIQHGYSVE